MKKLMMMMLIPLFLIYLSSCIQVITMTDMEFILIDEGFSLIEYQASQIDSTNRLIQDETECDCEVVRVIEGRMNQITKVYIIEFQGRSQAIDFFKFANSKEGNPLSSFEYTNRKQHIVILSIDEETASLFE